MDKETQVTTNNTMVNGNDCGNHDKPITSTTNGVGVTTTNGTSHQYTDEQDDSNDHMYEEEELADNMNQLDLSKLDNVKPNFRTPKEQEAYDELVANAVVEYFAGKFDKAELAFSKKADIDPLSALTIGAMKFFSAAMTCEGADIEAANNQLHYCQALAERECDETRPVSTLDSVANAVSSVGKFVGGFLFGGGNGNGKHPSNGSSKRRQSHSSVTSSGSKGNATSVADNTMKRHNSELRDNVIVAESVLLIALVQLLQENVIGFIKAGLNLRKGYKQFEALWQEIEEYGGLDTSLIDRHTLSAVSFGIGTINVVLSALPAKFLRMVSVLGYVGNREVGFKMLNACLEEQGLRSPLALMFLIFYYAALVPFAPEVLEPINGQKADKYIEYANTHYPGSPFYGVLIARYARQRRQLDKAVEDLTAISNVPWTERKHYKSTPLALKSWEALYHLCSYELGMTELYRLNFAKAAEHYKNLAEVQYWSQTTCRYLQAVCMEAAGDVEGAELAFKQVKEIPLRKYNGRVISSDQYVLRKAKARDENKQRGIERDSWRSVLEVIVIWNGHTCMQRGQIEKCRDWAEEALKTASGDDRGVTLWISGCMLKELGEYDQADERLSQAIKCKMHLDTLVGPFARYEQGVVAWLRGNKEAAKKHWSKAQTESSGYTFEFRLALRLHLCHMGMEETTASK
ncbi:hypothetical protein BDF22DRAFT_693816 [Syncephalis plumigaleata]|nr:hypothetical protein BDF22DRAFT_693816 [Syncephalis plumigaleata]